MKKFLWINPKVCNPPHRITHWDKFNDLKQSLSTGWKSNSPVLLGYKFNNKIQLISGSHRWAAMMELEKKIPVLIMDYEQVYELFGTEDWIEMVKNPPTLEEVNGN